MTLRVSGKNMDVGDALRSKAEGHLDTVVKKYFDGNYSGHMILEHEGSGYNAQCLVHLDTGIMLQSSAYGGDPISAYEIMAETIEQRAESIADTHLGLTARGVDESEPLEVAEVKDEPHLRAR